MLAFGDVDCVLIINRRPSANAPTGLEKNSQVRFSPARVVITNSPSARLSFD
ncbi:hypothetical protein [Gloeocapsopsis dulcis]|uniref:hypothetical protein n=1 Tax=Gloeocapsopsis dulcis TaxID=2859516 RepID=UPI0012DA2715|nr:hypothetical protein [Gloeocapsopsis dulcis]WNN88416.1 hypothetical protein P0S91_19325 [Gloeocapsopsis dulcis]